MEVRLPSQSTGRGSRFWAANPFGSARHVACRMHHAGLILATPCVCAPEHAARLFSTPLSCGSVSNDAVSFHATPRRGLLIRSPRIGQVASDKRDSLACREGKVTACGIFKSSKFGQVRLPEPWIADRVDHLERGGLALRPDIKRQTQFHKAGAGLRRPARTRREHESNGRALAAEPSAKGQVFSTARRCAAIAPACGCDHRRRLRSIRSSGQLAVPVAPQAEVIMHGADRRDRELLRRQMALGAVIARATGSRRTSLVQTAALYAIMRRPCRPASAPDRCGSARLGIASVLGPDTEAPLFPAPTTLDEVRPLDLRPVVRGTGSRGCRCEPPFFSARGRYATGAAAFSPHLSAGATSLPSVPISEVIMHGASGRQILGQRAPFRQPDANATSRRRTSDTRSLSAG